MKRKENTEIFGIKIKRSFNKDELERLYKERLSNYSEKSWLK